MEGNGFEIWQLLESGVSMEIREGNRIRIGKSELNVKAVRCGLNAVREAMLTSEMLGPDSVVRSSRYLEDSMVESRMSQGLSGLSHNMVTSHFE